MRFCVTVVKKKWDEYRIAKQYICQGDILSKVEANKIMHCPNCRCALYWNEDTFQYHCSNRRCSFREVAVRYRDTKEYIVPPSGSDYWLHTIGIPRWFSYELI